MAKDPIERLRKKIVADDLASEAELDAEMREVEREMENALKAAKAAPLSRCRGGEKACLCVK